jgi:hypothetical protein
VIFSLTDSLALLFKVLETKYHFVRLACSNN